MRKPLVTALLCASLVCSLATDSHARGGRGWARGGVVMGPFGPLYDTRSPEWRMSGGNFFTHQRLMRAKMAAQRERFMLKRMQQVEKLRGAKAKSKGEAGSKPHADARPSQPQFTQPVRVDELGRPLINRHRPRGKAKTPGATKPGRTAE